MIICFIEIENITVRRFIHLHMDQPYAYHYDSSSESSNAKKIQAKYFTVSRAFRFETTLIADMSTKIQVLRSLTQLLPAKHAPKNHRKSILAIKRIMIAINNLSNEYHPPRYFPHKLLACTKNHCKSFLTIKRIMITN